ncbi:MAG: Tad domain-containing protein [Dehalobacter sp.]|nr:Tad domain-containing protein [Dehalobacter sp.]
MKTPKLLEKYVSPVGNRGIAVVYLAILLFVLVGFTALAIDIGYKYVASTQLQNAADSASLAGVSRLPKRPATTNIAAFNNLSAARKEAWRFAASNIAAKKSVFLVQSSNHTTPPNNLNNANDENGDIVVGHWSKTGGFTLPNGVNSINAVKVVSRRIKSGSVSDVSIGDNPLPTFFGKIFKMNDMSTEASAIAAAVPGATNYILMCSTYNSAGSGLGLECISNCTYPKICAIAPRILDKGAGTPYANAFAWTSLSKQNTPNSYLDDLTCGRIFPNEDVCNGPVYTTGGQTSTLKALESAMYDPHYDISNKEFDNNGNVKAWWVIIPLINDCPPRVQPTPFHVDRFALIRIIQACGSGGGNACKGNNYKAPSCPFGQNNVLVIDRYSCMDCAQKERFIGLKWNLVK